MPGVSIAYWGPQIKVGVPQHALNVNMDAHTNVESLTFNFDARKKKLPIVFVQNEATKIPIGIPIPDITPLNPPLGIFGLIGARDQTNHGDCETDARAGNPVRHRQGLEMVRRGLRHRLARCASIWSCS